MVIYLTVNLITGEMYIGKDVKNRKNYFGSGIAFKSAIKKYSKEAFYKFIIDKANTKEELCKKEKYWIKYYNTFWGRGYNLTPGGDGGDTWKHIQK